MKLLDYLGTLPRTRLKAASFASIVLLGIVDYRTGTELALSVFYLVPICVMAWFIGRRAGYLTSLLCAAVWLVSNFLYDVSYSHAFIPYWNALVRLAVFLFSAALISEIAVRKRVEEQLRAAQENIQFQMRERTAEFGRLKFLEKQVAEISEREQRRIGQDLHDGLCQHLVSAAFATAVLRQRLLEKGLSEAEEAENISEMISEGITQARELARGLYPVRLEVDGLSSALEEFAESLHSKTKIAFSCDQPVVVHDLTAGTNLFRIAQEAVINAVKHSNGQTISIDLRSKNGLIELIVADDGRGISKSETSESGMGLHIMQYRARMIGASLNISPNPTGGTLVICSYSNQRDAIQFADSLRSEDLAAKTFVGAGLDAGQEPRKAESKQQ